jgi:hypothetical protein
MPDPISVTGIDYNASYAQRPATKRSETNRGKKPSPDKEDTDTEPDPSTLSDQLGEGVGTQVDLEA